MALTKISRGLLDTGVSDSSDSTAITIDSSERVQIGSTGITSTIDSTFHAHQSVDGDAIYYLFNDTQSSSSSTNETTQLYLGWRDAATGVAVAPRIVAGKEGDFTTAGNADSFLAFHTSVDNTLGEKVRITSAGNVGIGTSSPSKQLEIRNDTATSGQGGASLRLTRGDSSAAENDPIGTIEFYSTDADGAHVSSFIKGIAQEQYGRQGALIIGTASTNATDATELGRFDSTNLKLGRTSGSIGAEEQGIVINKSGYVYLARDGSSSATVIAFARNTDTTATTAGVITCNSGTSTVYGTSSDYRLKENVTYNWDATTRLKQLKPARFNFIADADTIVDGFLAHEVSDIVPEAIVGEKDGTESVGNILDADGNISQENLRKSETVINTDAGETWQETTTTPLYQQIDQAKLVPLLVKTIQELEARITTLENA